MIQGLYTSATGMQSHSTSMNVVGQNLANQNTVGFKKQLWLIGDLMSDNYPAGAAYELEVKQIGVGSHISEVRTNFKIGAFEPGSAETDLAISGKGFFQVALGDEVYYTRAGNFRFDENGFLNAPTGHHLMGYPINQNGTVSNTLQPVQVNTNNASLSSDPPKATTNITASLNLFNSQNIYEDEENPYFSMVKNWNANNEPPLRSDVKSIGLQYYDANGMKQSVNLYLDPVTAKNGEQVYEYVIAADPSMDARPGYQGTKSAGLLMTGTMTFSSAGELMNMNSFTPSGGDLSDLNNWTLSNLQGGTPSITLQQPGLQAQTISLNLGMKSNGNGWTNGLNQSVNGITAASIGDSFRDLPGMTNPEFNSNATTALRTNSSLKNLSQDGYTRGELQNMFVDENGIVQLSYTNGQSHDLYQIPLARFTSEDGLYRAGNNLYQHTSEAGQVEFGTAGTENYGDIISQTLETSNVDIASEMANMIVLQRGFQSNSKSLQTVDTMLQRALELKRN